jgi:hypothetical protein
MERIRLRECPFCGSQAKLGKWIHPASGSEYITVGCTNEDCVVHIGRLLLFEKGSEELAAARWNCRPVEDDLK